MEYWTDSAGGYTARVTHDGLVMNPRTDYDHAGTLFIAENRYFSGDKNADPKPPAGAVCLPVYAYIHSGVTISDKPFHCPWDSGQAGVIYMIPPEGMTEAQARDILRGEIAEYDAYLRGDCYQWKIVDSEGTHVDCVSGYIGDLDHVINEARHTLAHYANQESEI